MSKLLKNSSKGKSPLLGGGIPWTLKQMSLHLLLPSCKACGHAAWTCTVVRGTVWGCWERGAAGVEAGTTVVVAPQSCMADCSCFTLSCPLVACGALKLHAGSAASLVLGPSQRLSVPIYKPVLSGSLLVRPVSLHNLLLPSSHLMCVLMSTYMITLGL